MPASFRSFLVGLCLLATLFTHAQWNHQTLFTQHIDINCIAKDPTNSFCIAGAFNLFKNTGNPTSWTNITNNANNYFKHNSLIIYDNNHILSVGKLFNPSNAGVMITYDGGANWTTIDLGGTGFEMTDVARNGSTLIAVGTWGKIYRSTNDGVSWTNIPSGTTNDLHTVCYNPASNQWYIGGLNKRMTSFDNGLTYASPTVAGEIFDIRYENNFLIETSYAGTFGKVLKLSGSGAILNTYQVPYQLNTTTTLPDGNLISSGRGNKFVLLDQASNNVLISIDSIHNLTNTSPEDVNEMVFLNSVGYAVGPDGALGYRNSPFTFNGFVPATFGLSEDEGCSGEPFTAIATNSNATSYSWYFDSVLIGTNDTLNYTFSPVFGNHTISLVTDYLGLRDSILKNSFTYYNVLEPMTFNLNFPDSVCYGSDAVGMFHDTSPTTFVSIKIRTTNTDLYYINASSQNWNYTITIPNMTQEDTLFMEYTQGNECDTVTTVFSHPIYVRPDVSNAFSIIATQPTYCFPYDSIQFQLVSNVAGISYTLKNSSSIPGYLNSPVTSTITPTVLSTADTSTYQFPNTNPFYPGYSSPVYNNTFGVNMLYNHRQYLNKISVDFSYEGCPVQNVELVSFTVQNPYAMFHSGFGTQINDTVKIVNDQVNTSQTWSSTISNGFSSQLNAIAPIMGSYQSGEEQITLINQSSYGCVDTITKSHAFLDPVASDNSMVHCFNGEFRGMTVIGSIVDQNDNLYEYGYDNAPFGTYSKAIVRKISSNGTVLWEKVLPNQSMSSTAINRFTAGTTDNQGNTYFARLTDTDASIYVFNKNGIQIGGFSPFNNAEISEILVDGPRFIYTNRLGVHVYNLQFTPNPAFTFVQSFATGIPVVASNSDHFFLKKVAANDFIYVARTTYSNSVPTVINGFSVGPDQGTVLIGAKLSLTNGFSNQTVLAHTSVSNIPLIHAVSLDAQNNCYFLVNEFDYFNQEYQILDSAITLDGGPFSSFLVKTNNQFDLLSLTKTNLRKGKIEYWKNNQFLLSGIGYDGLKLKRPANYQSLKNAVSSKQYALSIATVDTSCSLVSGQNFKLFYNLSPVVNANSNTIYMSVRNFGSPNADTIVLPFNSEVIAFDSSFVLKLSTTNCLTTQDTFAICSSDNSFLLNYSSQADSVAYTIHTNGTSDSGYFPIENNFIVGEMPASTNAFTLELYDPSNALIDSFNYVINQTHFPDIDSVYTLSCVTSLNIFLNDPDITNYEWNYNGTTTNGQSLVVPAGSLQTGAPVTAYLTTIDFQGCKGTQEFELLKLNDPAVPYFPPTMDLLCGYPLQLAANPASAFQSVEWTILGNTYTSNPIYIPATAINTTGSFTVTINGEDIFGCPFTDLILVDACSDLSLEEESLKISVYPNPSRDYFIVDLANNYAEVDFQLSDLNGKVLLVQHEENTHSVRISTEGLARGYYMLSGKLSSGISIPPISIVKD